MLAVVLISGAVYFLNRGPRFPEKPVPRFRPLLKYTYDALKKRPSQTSNIKLTQLTKEYPGYSVWQFTFVTDNKQVSGVANLPAKTSTGSALTRRVVIMDRGYADVEEYYPGFGTERLAAYLAQNGFVTLAPDFLGYGDSDKPSSDAFEERFEAYTTVADLIASVQQACSPNCSLGLWGHSNGGQITLSVKEITGLPLPTVLWNPVSKPFPYSILYYTDTFDDRGKTLRKSLAKFEEDYDVENYSLTNYLDWITGPMLLQQGELDKSVPLDWSKDLYKALKDKGKEVDFQVYPGADHNMMPKWEAAAKDTLKFFQTNL